MLAMMSYYKIQFMNATTIKKEAYRECVECRKLSECIHAIRVVIGRSHGADNETAQPIKLRITAHLDNLNSDITKC